MNLDKEKKVALVELGASHAECIYSQYLFLKSSGYEIFLICNQKLSRFTEYLDIAGEIYYFEFGEGFAKDWKNLRKIKKLLVEKKIKKVIFNSASGIIIRNMMTLRFPKNMELTGVLHSTEKLSSSFTQKFINRKINKYFVLNDYIKELFTSNDLFLIESFYPIFYPEFDFQPLEKNSNEFWICIPGTIEYYRKDYLELLNRMKLKTVNSNVKFIMLGNAGHINSDAPDLKLRIEKNGLMEYFKFFDSFIPDDIFHSYIKASDLIMPLYHESHSFFREINGFKISGSFNLAFGYKKPLFCEISLKKFDDFKENGIFYTLDNLVDVINDLSSNCQILSEFNDNSYKSPKWDFEYQKNKYISFIERVS